MISKRFLVTKINAYKNNINIFSFLVNIDYILFIFWCWNKTFISAITHFLWYCLLCCICITPVIVSHRSYNEYPPACKSLNILTRKCQQILWSHKSNKDQGWVSHSTKDFYSDLKKKKMLRYIDTQIFLSPIYLVRISYIFYIILKNTVSDLSTKFNEYDWLQI